MTILADQIARVGLSNLDIGALNSNPVCDRIVIIYCVHMYCTWPRRGCLSHVIVSSSVYNRTTSLNKIQISLNLPLVQNCFIPLIYFGLSEWFFTVYTAQIRSLDEMIYWSIKILTFYYQY